MCYSIDNADVRKILFDAELVDNNEFKSVLKKLLEKFKDHRKSRKENEGVEIENEKLCLIYCETKESLDKRKINNDEEINNMLDEIGHSLVNYATDIMDKFNISFASVVQNDSLSPDLNEKFRNYTRQYLKSLKNKNSTAFNIFKTKFLDSLDKLINMLKDTSDMDSKYVENIKKHLKYCVEIIPSNKNKKDKIYKAIDNISFINRDIDRKRFVLEVIKAIFLIVTLVLSPLGIKKISDLNTKRKFKDSICQIKNLCEPESDRN